MKVQILAVGKVKGPLAQSVAEYEKRAARYWKLGVDEVSSQLPYPTNVETRR